jgi:hypothetical protein
VRAALMTSLARRFDNRWALGHARLRETAASTSRTASGSIIATINAITTTAADSPSELNKVARYVADRPLRPSALAAR